VVADPSPPGWSDADLARRPQADVAVAGVAGSGASVRPVASASASASRSAVPKARRVWRGGGPQGIWVVVAEAAQRQRELRITLMPTE
jgi:hypothetical protein